MSFSHYTAAYDISNDRERRRVDKILKGFGFRVQKSLFECVLRRQDKSLLINKLESLNLETGFVKLYRLEASLKNPVIGKGAPELIDGDAAFVI